MTETPSNEELRKLAEKYPPPQSWYEEDFSMLFGSMQHGTYIGPCKELKGKTALLRVSELEVEAQFDDMSTGLGLGWHIYHKEDWEIDADFNS